MLVKMFSWPLTPGMCDSASGSRDKPLPTSDILDGFLGPGGFLGLHVSPWVTLPPLGATVVESHLCFGRVQPSARSV